MHHWDTFSSPQDVTAVNSVIDSVYKPLVFEEGASCKSTSSDEEELDEDDMNSPSAKKTRTDHFPSTQPLISQPSTSQPSISTVSYPCVLIAHIPDLCLPIFQSPGYLLGFLITHLNSLERAFKQPKLVASDGDMTTDLGKHLFQAIFFMLWTTILKVAPDSTRKG